MVRMERFGPVLRITLDRPDVHNAFNDELIARLFDAFSNLENEVRAIVLSGEGKSFSAGGDLEWMRKAASYTEDQNYEDALKLAKLFRSIAYCPAVVIAKVHGAAFGGGCGLVACADVAVCESDTKFAFSEVRLGLLPATISPFVIPKIGAGHARSLFSTGESFGADKALRIGLVHEVAPLEELDGIVNSKLEAILTAGPEACARAKQIALEGFASIEDAARALARARASEEGREGVTAFLEKRKARWST
jgi:methylglutaconyl-CoA hydratase